MGVIRGIAAAALRGPGGVCRVRLAGIDAIAVATPEANRSVVVWVNTCTPRGIEQPAVARLLTGLAAAGLVAVAPELPGLREGELTPRTLDALVRVARACGPRVALVGASTGAGLALLAAADERLEGQVTAVAAVAPFASLRNVLRLATTGLYGDTAYPADPLLALVARRSLAASAPDDPAVAPLLANGDPGRFDQLYAALSPATRELLEELSPVERIARIEAPVELAAAPLDPFFPLAEALALQRAGRDVRLTVTAALAHVRPRLRPGVFGLLGLVQRTVDRAACVQPRHAPSSVGRDEQVAPLPG